jgi:hypothetical protein
MKFYARIPRLKLRGRYRNFLRNTKQSFPLPWNINWLLSTANYLTTMDYPRYVHKPDIPLRPTVSSVDSPCCSLAEFLHKSLSPLAGNTDSFVKNSGYFLKLIQEINLQNKNHLVSHDVSSFTNVPVEEVLQVIRNRLNTDPSFRERSHLQVEHVME